MTIPPRPTAPGWRDRPAGFRPIRLSRRGRPAPAGPYAVVDVETTGLDPRVDRVLEVAVVRCDERGRPVSEWSSLVDPGRDPGPTAVHGITDADLRGAAPFAEVLPQLADQLDGAVVTAHNLAFDAAFLAAECERAGHPTPSGPGLCTLALARRVRPGQGAYSLAACSEAAGIELLEAHRALPDARATAQLLGVLLDAVPATRRPWPWRRLRLR